MAAEKPLWQYRLPPRSRSASTYAASSEMLKGTCGRRWSMLTQSAVEYRTTCHWCRSGHSAHLSVVHGPSAIGPRCCCTAEPAAAIDLLEKLLGFEPARRLCAEEALAHPLLSSLHGLNSEPVASPFDFAFEAASDPELKLLLNAEIKRFVEAATPPARAGEPPTAALPTPAEDVAGRDEASSEEQRRGIEAEVARLEAALAERQAGKPRRVNFQRASARAPVSVGGTPRGGPPAFVDPRPPPAPPSPLKGSIL